MKKLLFISTLLIAILISCQPEPGPQPQATNNTSTTTVTPKDSLVNYFEQKLIGTWKQQYRIRQTFSGGSAVYDTLAALDTNWTVTFTANNPQIPSNGYAPYKKDASGKLTEYTDQNPQAYIVEWYGLVGGSSSGIYTGTIWLLPVFTFLPLVTFHEAIGICIFLSFFKNHSNTEYEGIKKKVNWGTFIAGPWIVLVVAYLIYSIIH